MFDAWRVKVVKRRELLSNARVWGSAFGLGALAGFATLIFAAAPDRWVRGYMFALMFFFGVALPALLLVGCGHRIKSMGQAFLAGCGFGLGLLCVMMAATLFPFGGPTGALIVLLLFVLAVAAFFGLLTVLFLLAYRTWGRRVVVQDGTYCPACAYSLIGNTSMVCPECGTPFTFEDLDTPREAFEGLLEKSRSA